jgi:predicted nucleotidyltransferase
MPTALPEEIEQYRDGWNQRQDYRERKRKKRKERAERIVSELADILREEFGASRVYVFGSLTRDNVPFHEHSDIDLAVSGIPDERFYEAVGRCLGHTADFSVDLVDLENAEEALRDEIPGRAERVF